VKRPRLHPVSALILSGCPLAVAAVALFSTQAPLATIAALWLVAVIFMVLPAITIYRAQNMASFRWIPYGYAPRLGAASGIRQTGYIVAVMLLTSWIITRDPVIGGAMFTLIVVLASEIILRQWLRRTFNDRPRPTMAIDVRVMEAIALLARELDTRNIGLASRQWDNNLLIDIYLMRADGTTLLPKAIGYFRQPASPMELPQVHWELETLPGDLGEYKGSGGSCNLDTEIRTMAAHYAPLFGRKQKA
jgi:hypothetical protein